MRPLLDASRACKTHHASAQRHRTSPLGGQRGVVTFPPALQETRSSLNGVGQAAPWVKITPSADPVPAYQINTLGLFK